MKRCSSWSAIRATVASALAILALSALPSAAEYVCSQNDIVTNEIESSENNRTVSVFITVSSLAFARNDSIFERRLELNWNWLNNAAPLEDDWVGLFTSDPLESNADDPSERTWVMSEQAQGYYRTRVQFPRQNFTDEDLTEDRCLDFWVGYVQNNVTLASACLRIRPQWMWEHRDEIGELNLTQLMIPGTHDAGSYEVYRGMKSEDIFTRYKICQDEDILSQLVFGIRHLDLRVAYYSVSDEYWLNHGLVKIRPFRDVLQQIKRFVRHSNDVVLLDFHRFPAGFRDQRIRHVDFMTYVTDELSDHLVPRAHGYNVTLDQLWRLNRTVVALYSSSHYEENEYFWPGLPQVWANSNRVKGLKDHLDNHVKTKVRQLPYQQRRLWAAMAEMTPTAWDIVGSARNASLRTMADKVNRNVTAWFRDEWYREASVIASDFFLGNNMIEVAVQVNKMRAQCPSASFTKVA